MPADWSVPILTTPYDDLLDDLKARDVDAITLAEAPVNPPTNAIRWNRTLEVFQEWSGSAWVTMEIAVAGIDPGALGTMAAQNSNAVAITGGTLDAVLLSNGSWANGSFSAPVMTNVDIDNGAIDSCAIGGGTIAGAAITNGTIIGLTSLLMGGHIGFQVDSTYDIGAPSFEVRLGYFEAGLKIPVGFDRYAPA